MSTSPLTSHDTVERWLADPIGGAAFRSLLERGGQDAESLRPVMRMSLRSLVELGGGRFPQEAVDALVLAANDGVVPAEEHEAAAVGGASGGAQRFTGATIIVTGAGSGIGRATAQRIVAEGGRVVAVDVSGDRLDALAAEQPAGTIVPVVADITKADDIARIITATDGRIDGLANVAGIMDGMVPLHEADDALWRRVFAVNVDGTFALSRAVLSTFLEQGRGAIVNVASEAALRGNAAGTAYTASKHAVVGMTKSAAFLYGPSGIRVNAVAPGPTATAIAGRSASDFAEQRLAPFMALIPPVTDADDMASSIAWLLSADSRNINGIVLASDGGWSVQ
ncbi:SDR family oxidoreductase [Clavibacter michiganensis subsp. phaseoli]|uniref:SDR family oxidoreductase n=1 Tax=Clavibacter phaseoli TaxID=1734031 RepID=A0A8I0S9I6_9MICO|nr:SDR family oxidoreductase [Clavibacter phaseoli]MBF4632604.1 SDR family oxidoreductase [Clavibacter phaseoli]